jgi:hypothetical protein
MDDSKEEINNIIDHILIKLKDKINQIEKLKLDPEFILHVCNLIENSIPMGNKHNINKKDLALKVLSQVFGFNDNDKIEVSQQIDILHNCGKIKKTTFITNAKHYLSSLLNK